MSLNNPQPVDRTPHDHARNGDLARLHGADDVAGDHAPRDPMPSLQEQLADEAGPISGLNISAPFIKRPVATFLLSAAILIAGAVAYQLLPVASLPQVEFPTISVNASLPGADPDTMASAVATPLERQFSRIAGITQMTSSSGVGSTGITLQFDLDRDINGAARDVQAAINAARAQLPANMPSNPTYRKVNPSDSPILMLTLTSDTAPVAQMYDVSDSIVAQKIAQVQGVGQVNTGGSAKPAVRLEVDPNLLTAKGLGLESLRNAMSTVNVAEPTGYINGPDQRIEISTTDQLYGAAAYAPLIIATNNGAVTSTAAATGLPAAEASAVASATAATPSATSNFATSSIKTVGAANEHGIVRVQDVADVVDSVEDVRTGGYLNEKRAILIMVFKSPGANVIQAVDNIEKIMPQLQASIPPAIHLQVIMDRTQTIRASVRDITRTLIISIALVILVVFLFLREVRSTFIPSVSVPLSLMGTFGVMYMLGYTLDNLSLMALTISTGFVVDDAIVVIENISRHLEAGMSPFAAAMKGSREIGFTVLSMSTSLVAVFIPILLMGGIIGLLFREFAVTLSAALGISLIVSLTTTPMLAAKFLTPHDEIHKGWFYRTGEKQLQRITDEYARGLRWVLNHQGITLFVFLLTFGLNIYLFLIIPKGFFPQQDVGRLSGQIRTQQDTSFITMKQKMQDIVSTIDKDPAVTYAASFVGGGGSSNQANLFVILSTDPHRESADAILNRLRPLTSKFVGVTTYLQNAQELRIGGRSSATQYEYTLTADTVAELDTWGPRLMAAMKALPELKDVATDQQNNGLEADLVIDRDTASRLGVSALAIDSTLSDAFGQRQISTTYMPLNQYHVVMEVAQPFQNDPTALSKIYIRSTTGAEVPLSAITHMVTSRVPLTVNHQGLSPANTMSFNLSPGVSLSDATVAVEDARAKIGMPSSIHGGFQGTAQAFQQSLSTEWILVLLAIFTVYIVLGILYESFIHPITILSTLPSAGVGAFLALLAFKIDLSVIADIGILLLIGIVKKNAIMMIDFALVAERQHGKTPREAIYEACLLRFRPIMMTTMAAMLGGIPLALGTGPGSELRRPLGITIVGGLIVSQCLTLFTTPVIYLCFDRLRLALPRWRRSAADALGLRRPPQPEHHPAD